MCVSWLGWRVAATSGGGHSMTDERWDVVLVVVLVVAVPPTRNWSRLWAVETLPDTEKPPKPNPQPTTSSERSRGAPWTWVRHCGPLTPPLFPPHRGIRGSIPQAAHKRRSHALVQECLYRRPRRAQHLPYMRHRGRLARSCGGQLLQVLLGARGLRSREGGREDIEMIRGNGGSVFSTNHFHHHHHPSPRRWSKPLGRRRRGLCF